MTRPAAVPPPVTAVLDASSRWLPAQLGEVEKGLRELSAGHGRLLTEDSQATLAAGGKRLRPLLVLLCAGGNGGEAAIRAATAIELVHMATLVHDDVLDRAPLRRGHPTVAVSSGRERAVATGDLLFSRAFALLGEAGDVTAIGLLSEASLALARGELLQRGDAFQLGLSEQRYLERCRLKTAKLFSAACLLGYNAANPRIGSAEDDAAERGVLTEAEREIESFGGEVGLAFQLLDDVLDVAGPPERTGKARGTDLLDGTVTLPLIIAARLDRGIATVDLRSLDAESVEALCDRIAATGALEQVRSAAYELVAASKSRLGSEIFEPEQRHLLELVADGLVQRYS